MIIESDFTNAIRDGLDSQIGAMEIGESCYVLAKKMANEFGQYLANNCTYYYWQYGDIEHAGKGKMYHTDLEREMTIHELFTEYQNQKQ